MFEGRRLRHLTSFSANALNYSFHPVDLPLKPASHAPEAYDHHINLNETNLKGIAGIYYMKEKQDLLIEAVFITGVFPFRGKSIFFYEISDPSVKQDLLAFIRTHEDELFDAHFREKIWGMIFHHKRKLKEIGRGSMYRGIHDAGIISDIRAGMDPEAEWQKKFPAGCGAQEK